MIRSKRIQRRLSRNGGRRKRRTEKFRPTLSRIDEEIESPKMFRSIEKKNESNSPGNNIGNYYDENEYFYGEQTNRNVRKPSRTNIMHRFTKKIRKPSVKWTKISENNYRKI
jgi:hypothetical protein